MSEMNRQWRLARRPSGEVTPDCFEWVECALEPLADGQVRVRNRWLSLDPYMRGRMAEAKGYAANVELGDAMVGGTVGQVLKSRNPRFKEGDYVVEYAGWQSHAVSDGAKIGRALV